jgi:Xaa-Pro aminopeptidase
LRTKNISLLGITENLVDTVREPDVPPYSKTMLEDHPLVFSGQPTSEKLANVRRSLFGEDRDQDPENHGGIYVLPVLPAIAWLLNMRCQGDIPNVPVFRSYLALTPSRVCLFIDQDKLNEEVKQRLKADGVEWRDYGVEEVKRWVLEHRIRVREESGEKALEVEGRVLVPTSASWGLADAIGLVSRLMVSTMRARIETEETGMAWLLMLAGQCQDD